MVLRQVAGYFLNTHMNIGTEHHRYLYMRDCPDPTIGLEVAAAK